MSSSSSLHIWVNRHPSHFPDSWLSARGNGAKEDGSEKGWEARQVVWIWLLFTLPLARAGGVTCFIPRGSLGKELRCKRTATGQRHCSAGLGKPSPLKTDALIPVGISTAGDALTNRTSLWLLTPFHFLPGRSSNRAAENQSPLRYHFPSRCQRTPAEVLWIGLESIWTLEQIPSILDTGF